MPGDPRCARGRCIADRHEDILVECDCPAPGISRRLYEAGIFARFLWPLDPPGNRRRRERALRSNVGPRTAPVKCRGSLRRTVSVLALKIHGLIHRSVTFCRRESRAAMASGQTGLRVGRWQVDPARGLLKSGDREAHIEPRLMDLLL